MMRMMMRMMVMVIMVMMIPQFPNTLETNNDAIFFVQTGIGLCSVTYTTLIERFILKIRIQPSQTYFRLESASALWRLSPLYRSPAMSLAFSRGDNSHDEDDTSSEDNYYDWNVIIPRICGSHCYCYDVWPKIWVAFLTFCHTDLYDGCEVLALRLL